MAEKQALPEVGDRLEQELMNADSRARSADR